MNSGDMVYYLHTNQHGNQTKFTARVLSSEADGVRIRIGRFNVDTKEIDTMEAVVEESTLLPRSIPCSYEEELSGNS